MTRQELRRIVEENGFKACWPEIEIWLQREILLSPIESKFDDLSTGGTKQGGEPDLPLGLAWPKYNRSNISGLRNTSKPMTFLLQLRCGDIKPFASEPFPDHGLLSFFVAIEQNMLARDANDCPIGCVLYVSGSTPIGVDNAVFSEPLVRTPFPRGLYFGNRLPPCSLKIELSHGIGFESLNEVIERHFGYSPERSEQVWDFYNREIIPADCHKMFGSPSMFELDIAEECRLLAKQSKHNSFENADWQLLLEYDLADLSMENSGRLYFMIRRDDLATCDFDDVYVLHDAPH